MNEKPKSMESAIPRATTRPDEEERDRLIRRLLPTLLRLRAAIVDLLHSRSATIGLAIILSWVVIALLAPILSPHSPTDLVGARLQAPSEEHWLGTDNVGRDVLSRLFWGTRTVLLLAPISVLLGILIGAPLGLVSGYVGGRLDTLIMRGCDVLLSFPTLLIYVLIITSIGPSAIIVVVSVAIGAVPAITRIVRSLALDERTKDYVNAARLRGERRQYILLREILPNVSGPVIVDSCIRVGYAIMAIGSLGFLGLGIPPPTPDWGGMINEGRQWIFLNPWVVLAPAAALSSVVVGLNLLADGLREVSLRR